MEDSKKYEQVYDYLIRYIDEHQLQAGDNLPSEAKISKELKVSRITIQHAIQKLIHEQIAYRVQGSGTYLSNKPAPQTSVTFIPMVISSADKMYGLSEYIVGAEAYLKEKSCFLTVHYAHDDPISEQQILKQLIDTGARCIILYVAQRNGAKFYADYIKNGISFIFLDRLPNALNADLVTSDNLNGGIQGCEYLINAGHRRIAFFCGINNLSPHDTVSDRYMGYNYAMEYHGLSQHQRLLRCRSDLNCTVEYLSEIYSQPDPPTALFTVNDCSAGMVISALRMIGLNVPEDVSVIGYDGQLLADSFTPRITSVQQAFFDIGYQAAALAFERLHQQENMVFTHKLFPVKIHEGESVKVITNNDQ